jgi:hypothetical protein
MTSTYLAVFTGSKTGAAAKAWGALSDSERRAKEQQGMAAWGAWMAKHKSVLVDSGGPLGKTKRVSQGGVADVSNELAGFVVVRAASHEEAAKMFDGHPHFTIFPGDAVDVMPVMPIPGA